MVCDIVVLVFAIFSWILLKRNIENYIKSCKTNSILEDLQIENVMQGFVETMNVLREHQKEWEVCSTYHWSTETTQRWKIWKEIFEVRIMGIHLTPTQLKVSCIVIFLAECKTVAAVSACLSAVVILLRTSPPPVAAGTNPLLDAIHYDAHMKIIMFIWFFLFNIYSSDMTHKEKRKARVKQYLRQLKAMVPPSSGKKGKMGTLSALQHVIGSLQKIQGMHLIDGAGDRVFSGLYIMYY